MRSPLRSPAQVDIHFDGMYYGQGASMALPIWGLYMNKVYADKELGYSQEDTFNIPIGYDPCKGITEVVEDNLMQNFEELFQ